MSFSQIVKIVRDSFWDSAKFEHGSVSETLEGQFERCAQPNQYTGWTTTFKPKPLSHL